MNQTTIQQVSLVHLTGQEAPQSRNVAAYARVSLEKDTMMHSFSAQVDYYSRLIGKKPDWNFTGVYADE